MEPILLMNSKELLNELRKYNLYKNQTDYYIKKAVAHEKTLATVDELKNELLKLIKSINVDLIKVGSDMYTENELLQMIQFYKQHHQIQTNYLQHQDILHNIMLQSDIGSTNTMLRTSKLAQKNKLNFWMNKLKHDYPLVIPKSTNWEEEYKKIYKEYQRAKQFVEVLKLIKHDSEKGKDQCNFAELYIDYRDKKMDLNELTMLPNEIKNILINVNEPVINLTIDKVKKKNVYQFKINLEGIKVRKHVLITSVELNEDNYIMFLTSLLYFNPEFEIWDADENPYLYDPYNQQPSEPTETWLCVWKYWKKILPQNKF